MSAVRFHVLIFFGFSLLVLVGYLIFCALDRKRRHRNLQKRVEKAVKFLEELVGEPLSLDRYGGWDSAAIVRAVQVGRLEARRATSVRSAIDHIATAQRYLKKAEGSRTATVCFLEAERELAAAGWRLGSSTSIFEPNKPEN